MAHWIKFEAAERAHNARCKEIAREFATTHDMPAEEVTRRAIAAEAAWAKAVAIFKRERA